jgi:hypothetical protein
MPQVKPLVSQDVSKTTAGQTFGSSVEMYGSRVKLLLQSCCNPRLNSRSLLERNFFEGNAFFF